MRSFVYCYIAGSLLLHPVAAFGELTSADVEMAVQHGIAALERLQGPNGNWVEYDSQPGGVTALCTLALLRSGRNTDEHERIRRALNYLEKLPDPERTYNASLMIMAFAAADAKKYKAKMEKLAQDLAARQMRNDRTKGGWSYKGPNDGNADNSNTHFAMLALHQAQQFGASIPDKIWQQAQRYWLQSGMQVANGGYSYGLNQKYPTGSMTCAGISSLIIADNHLRPLETQIVNGAVQCCSGQAADERLTKATQWLGNNFTVARNPNREGSLLYYLHSLEHAGEASGQRFITTTNTSSGKPLDQPALHDWYREGCEFLVSHQNKFNGSWVGTGQMGENRPDVATAFALLFLSHGRRPVVIARLQHHRESIGDKDWNHHVRSLPNLVWHTARQWGRNLACESVDFSRWNMNKGGAPQEKTLVTTADLLEFPVLFLSGTEAVDFDVEQRRLLKEYVENGGTLLAEACGDRQTSAAAFDQSFRHLMGELLPGRELKKLANEHAVWRAQQAVDVAKLPSDLAILGLDVCGCTSVFYCPRSLSCYWELAGVSATEPVPANVREQVDQVTRLGCNLLTYATRREFKQRLDRPLLSPKNPGGRPRPHSLVVPTLRLGDDANEPPTALNHMLSMVEQRFATPFDYDDRKVAATVLDPKSHRVAFMHGSRSFQLSADERMGLKNYLDGGGFLFAAAVLSIGDFADSVRRELKAIYPESSLSSLAADHPLFSEEFGGFAVPAASIRSPREHPAGGPLETQVTKVEPRLEGLTVQGRLVAILSPIDITCALTRGGSLEHETYLPIDAARLGTCVMLYGLQRRSRLR